MITTSTYDFTTRIDRRGTGSAKWEGMYHACPDVPAGIVPFSVADMEFKNPPEVAETATEYVRTQVLGYTEPTDAYFDAVCGWQRRRHGWDVSREWVVTSPGVVPALFECVKAFTEPGDGVIVQPPVYYPFRRAVEQTGRAMVENPLVRVDDDHYEMDFVDLERKAADPANKMIIVCSPHNPVGRVWTADELRRLVEICLANDVLVVCDEIHNDLVMPGVTHTTIQRVVPEERRSRVITCTAPSKTFNLAGLQCSNIIIPGEDERKQFLKSRSASTGQFGLNAFAYPVCRAVYERCEGWLEELLGVLDANRRLLADFLESELPQAKAYPLEGTYLQWVDFRWMGLPDKELEAFMQREARLFLDEGYLFGTGGSGFERFNIACPRDVLQEGLERLVAAVRARG